MLVVAMGITCFSQDTLHIRVIGHVKSDAIQLRWGVNSPVAWTQTNKYGFRVERFTVVRDNEMLATPEKVVLAENIRPQPLEKWETLATENGYAAIIAQAIYGERFELSGDDAKGVSRFIALAQEQEQRYLVSLYAADLCYPAALLAGWGFEDKTVRRGERYLYRVIAAVPQNILRIDHGSAYVSLEEFQPLPQPQELTAVFGDKTAMLTWNYGILKNTYNAYYVEKSSDGKTFARLSDIPLMNMNGHDGKVADRMYYIDSLNTNSVKAYYRIIGVTAFSEQGPPSEVVSGEGMARLMYVPHINRAVPNEQGVGEIQWEFDERGNASLRFFELRRGDNDTGPFVPVISGIPPDKRNVTYDKLEASNYFVVAAVPLEGDPVLSFPVLVQPVDSIPPAVPFGLEGVIDTLGIVRLTWKANTDRDLLGYRVFRGQTKQEELIPLNDVAIRENSLTDTIEVRNLNFQVYYAVTALDMRYNQSQKSVVLELLKPDIVPPSSPVITNYKVTDQGISLEWVTGQEENIASLHLFREDKGANEKTLIQTFTDVSVTRYTDNTTEPGKMYGYFLTAVTSRGKSSDPSPVVTLRSTYKPAANGKFTQFAAKVNRKKKRIELEWTHNLFEVDQFELYKGEAGRPVTLWKVIPAYEKKLDDIDVRRNSEYKYIIRAVMKNGKSGATASVNVRSKM